MYIKLLVLSIIITSLLFAFFNNIYLTIKSIHLDEKPSFIKSMTYQFLNVIIIFTFLLMLEKPSFIKSMTYQFLNVIIIFTFLLMLVIFSQYGDEIMNLVSLNQ